MKINGINLFIGIVSIIYIWKNFETKELNNLFGFLFGLLVGVINFYWAFPEDKK